jgi:hypothetical protein
MKPDQSNPTFQRTSGAPNPSSKPAMERFLQSMNIGYMEWHDGIGYDLDTLKEMNLKELNQVESLILSRKAQDWRDVKALAALNTPFTIQALKDSLASNNFDVRLFAVKFLKEMDIEDHIEEIVVNTLPLTKIGDGLTFALSLAEKFPTQRIRQTVLSCALNGNDDIRIHCAAMALFLYGKSKSNFDSSFKIVFEFRNPDRAQRLAPFIELCKLIGIDSSTVINV